MTKKVKIWIGVGAVALYLLWKNNKKKTVAVFLETEQAVGNVKDTVKGVLNEVVETKSCEEKIKEWQLISRTRRWVSVEAMRKAKSEFLGKCETGGIKPIKPIKTPPKKVESADLEVLIGDMIGTDDPKSQGDSKSSNNHPLQLGDLEINANKCCAEKNREWKKIAMVTRWVSADAMEKAKAGFLGKCYKK